jgi:hypothetical protein
MIKQNVAHQQTAVPQIVDRRFAMKVTGKIQKFRMREIMAEELGLQGSVRIKTA